MRRSFFLLGLPLVTWGLATTRSATNDAARGRSSLRTHRSSFVSRFHAPLPVREFRRRFGGGSSAGKAPQIPPALLQRSFLAARRSTRSSTGTAVRTGLMHATQYYGDLTVGGQPFAVIFDSGSGHLLVPGKKCGSTACTQKNRHVYDLSKSSGKKGMAIGWTDEPETAVDESSEDRDVTSISFAAGEVVGNYYRDDICLGSGSCALADFIAMSEESDNPFKDSVWDGVLGLGQDLSENPQFSVLQRVFDEEKKRGSSGSAVFSFFLHDFGGEIAFGRDAVAGQLKAGAEIVKAPVSVDGYWQFDLEDVTVGGKRTNLCQQYKGGKCQAVVDTGSSLLMAPANLLSQLSKKLDIDDKCERKNLPAVGFLVNGVNLELPAEEYLDRDEKECFIAMMPVGDTGRGPIFVLGYPFLRNFFTTFDFDKKELTFARKADVKPMATSSGAHTIKLTGIRPS